MIKKKNQPKIDHGIDLFLLLFQSKSISFGFHPVFCRDRIPRSLGWPLQRPQCPHARSTIINSRQCHRLAFPESSAEEDDSSGLLRTCCIIPFNYCSFDSVQPLIRQRCSASPQWGQWTGGNLFWLPVWGHCFSGKKRNDTPECTEALKGKTSQTEAVL